MSRPVEVFLPTSNNQGQIIGCMAVLLRALGWDLGELYDARMRLHHGDDWLEELRKVRNAEVNAHIMYRRPINIHDPSFGINEPLRHSGSPLRAFLPRGRDFYDLLDEVAKIRNAEQHFDRQPNLSGLKSRAQTIGSLAEQVGIDVARDCQAVVERVEAIEDGQGFDEDSSTLVEQLASERERARELATQVAAQRTQLINAQAAGDANQQQLERNLAALEEQRAALEEQLTGVQVALETERAAARATAEMPAAKVGEAWTDPLPDRVLRLLPHVRDLFDSQSVSLLSDDVGDVAHIAAESWMTWLPHGGTVHLSPEGHAVTLLGTTWTYLGRLDDAAESEGGRMF